MRIWLALFLLALLLSIGADFLLRDEGAHALFGWSGIMGFFALFGFLGCLILVGVSKSLGHAWLQRRENYYHDKHPR